MAHIIFVSNDPTEYILFFLNYVFGGNSKRKCKNAGILIKREVDSLLELIKKLHTDVYDSFMLKRNKQLYSFFFNKHENTFDTTVFDDLGDEDGDDGEDLLASLI